MSTRRFCEVVAATDWDALEPVLVRLYPDAQGALEIYHEAFVKLRDLRPEYNVMRIAILMELLPGIDDSPSLVVVGKNGSLNRDQPDFRNLGKPDDSPYALTETEFGLEFHRWSEWLGMAVEVQTLDGYGDPVIVAHCLHEMTFFGFEEEIIQAQRAEIERRADLVAAMSDEERERTLIPLDDVICRIRGMTAPRT